MDNGQQVPREQLAPQQGGASQLIADTHSGLMKVMDLVQAQYPDIAQKIGGAIQMFQQAVDDLQSPADQQSQGEAVPSTTTPEAGAAKVQQVL